MMKRHFKSGLSAAFMILSLMTGTGVGQTQNQIVPTCGTAAPAVSLDVIQPTGTGALALQSLKGSAVVLEFWATWCSGCVAQIPHINQLVATFQDKNVKFVSVTDEDKSVVTAFLAKRPMSGMVAVDPRSTAFKAFAIFGRPYTALIDRDGVLRAMTTPAEVNERVIDRLIAGTLPLQAPSKGTPVIGTEPDGPLPVLQILVRPAMSTVGMSPGATRRTGNRWEAWGMDLNMLLSAYRFPQWRIVVPDDLPTSRYDVSMVLPDEGIESQRAVLRQLISSLFGVRVRLEPRAMDVWVLTRTTGGSSDLRPSDDGYPVAAVVGLAESVLKRTVVDETGLKAKYAFALARPRSEQDFLSVLKGLGFELSSDRRNVDVLIVERPSGQ